MTEEQGAIVIGYMLDVRDLMQASVAGTYFLVGALVGCTIALILAVMLK